MMRLTMILIIALTVSSVVSADPGSKLVIAHYMTDMVPRTDRPLHSQPAR